MHHFGFYYRPPDEHYEEIQSLHKQLEQIRSFHPPQSQPSIHVVGDFNFRKIDWKTHLTKEGEVLGHSEGLILIDIARDHYFDQMLLDLIFTNTPGLANNCRSSPDKFSDHSAVAFTLNTLILFKRKPRLKVYLFNKGDYDSLRSELQELQESFFQSTSEDTDIEEDWELFKSALTTSADRNIPSKMVSGRSKLPWLSARLRHLIRRKNRIHANKRRLVTTGFTPYGAN